MTNALIRRVADRLDQRFNHRSAKLFLHEIDEIAAIAVEETLNVGAGRTLHPQPGTSNDSYHDGAPHGI